MDPPHEYHTRFQAKARGMASPRVEDSLAQLVAKIDDGNKDMSLRMEAIQATMEKMESTVQGLVVD
jgi:hypothetical protein